MNSKLKKILESYMKEGDKIHEKLNNKSLNEVKSIYHFTSANAFTEIIKRRTLRFTDFRCFNDPLELGYAKKLTCSTFKKLSLPSKDKHFLENFLNMFYKNMQVNDDELSVYISCFAIDVNNLDLWRFYADDGCGMVIGFDSRFNLEDKSVIKNERPSLLKIIYDEDKFEELINKFVELTNKSYNNAEKQQKSIYNDNEFLQKLGSRFLSQVLPLLSMAKHSSYQLEKEYRMYLMEGSLYCTRQEKLIPFFFPDDRRGCLQITKKESKINNMNIIKDAAKEKRFIECKPFAKETIKEIWIGPRCDKELAVQEIKALLDENGYDISNIRINQCDLPYVG